jgi:undecaprenyl-phosphate 4-deoxy-4-formamido-L-arabinose transferase
MIGDAVLTGHRFDGVSVVVPVFDSESSLVPLLDRLEMTLAPIARRFEVILVNDGSRDQSWSVIAREAAARARVAGIDLSRNYGQHNALLCGIRAAQYELIVTMDDDLQNPPEMIPTLLQRLSHGYDVVYGAPEHEAHGVWRDVASQTTKLVLGSVLGADTARQVCGFRAFRRDLRSAFQNYDGPAVNLDVLLTWGTTRFCAVRVPHEPRRRGRSSYTFAKLMTHALNMLTGFSIVPLQIATLMGFSLTLFGAILLVIVLARYAIQGVLVPGFTFLASVIVVFSGAQLFTLGVIGEYVARMHFRIMQKPSYSVRTCVGAAQASDAAQT